VLESLPKASTRFRSQIDSELPSFGSRKSDGQKRPEDNKNTSFDECSRI
jgi:hypothetical protein